MLSNISKKELELFREKWGQFYYSDTIGMDWEKPKKQNVTGGIPNKHDGFCIASGDIEKDILSSHIALIEGVIEREKSKLGIVRQDMSIEGSIVAEKIHLENISHLKEQLAITKKQ